MALNYRKKYTFLFIYQIGQNAKIWQSKGKKTLPYPDNDGINWYNTARAQFGLLMKITHVHIKNKKPTNLETTLTNDYQHKRLTKILKKPGLRIYLTKWGPFQECKSDSMLANALISHKLHDKPIAVSYKFQYPFLIFTIW